MPPRSMNQTGGTSEGNAEANARRTEKPKGLRGTSRRNLEPYKECIIKLVGEGKSLTKIKQHLFEEYKTNTGTSTLSAHLKKWNIPFKFAKGTSSGLKRNLDSFKSELLQWDREGFTPEDMMVRLRDGFNTNTSVAYIQRHFHLWTDPHAFDWRAMDKVPSQSSVLSQTMPTNLLSTDDLQTLDDGIKAAYQNGNFSKCDWFPILVDAACYDPTIQALAVKDFLQAGHHWSNDRTFNPLWVIGIQLPGSFVDRTLKTKADIVSAANALAPKILKKVHNILLGYIKEGLEVTDRERGPEHLKAALEMNPATTPPSFVAAMLRLTRDEVTTSQHDVGLSDSLSLLPLRNFPACEALSQHLPTAGRPSLLAELSKEVFAGLEEWDDPDLEFYKLPALTPSDMLMVTEHISSQDPGEHATPDDEPNAQDEDIEMDLSDDDRLVDDEELQDDDEELQGDEVLMGETENAGDEAETVAIEKMEACVGEGERTQQQKYGRLYSLLCNRVRVNIRKRPLVFGDWRAPTTGALSGCPPARFQFAAWEPKETPLLRKILDRGSEFDEEVTGTMGNTEGTDRQGAEELQSFLDFLNFTETDKGPVDLSPSQVLFTSILYLKKLISSQSDKERDEYKKICARFASCSSRSAIMEKIDVRGVTWSPLIRDDDWWHCRRLLQMLAKRYDLPQQIYQSFERKLMLVLAAIEGGSTEAVLWLMAVEGLLKEISHGVKRFGVAATVRNDQESRVQDELLRDFVAFVYAVALNNIALRFHSRRGGDTTAKNEATNVQKWYTIIVQSRPACSNPSCLRLLPSPQRVTKNTIRRIFSVGVRESRTGSKGIRSFISTNRRDIFQCLYTWLRRREPHPALVLAFLWAGDVYHTDSSCKAKRGKRE